MKNKQGKIVSVKKSQLAKAKFPGSPIQKWCEAVKKARKDLKVQGFQPVKKGSSLYKKAQTYYKK